MNAYNIVGYVFTFLGFIVLLAGFFAPLNDMFSVSNAALIAGSADPQSLVLQLFVAPMIPWIGLSVTFFVISGVGFYAGRKKVSVKSQTEVESVNERLSRIEKALQENSETINKRLELIEEKHENQN
jgi:hypothetical protein